MKKIALMLLTFLPLLLGGCTGGQEIESSLFVIAMAVDAAPEGNLTITVKALSGSQESAASGTSGAQSETGSTENLEQTETGYIVLSATAPRSGADRCGFYLAAHKNLEQAPMFRTD